MWSTAPSLAWPCAPYQGHRNHTSARGQGGQHHCPDLLHRLGAGCGFGHHVGLAVSSGASLHGHHAWPQSLYRRRFRGHRLHQGAVIGGVALGFVEIMTVAFMPELSGYRDAFAFVLLVLVLFTSPRACLAIARRRKSDAPERQHDLEHTGHGPGGLRGMAGGIFLATTRFTSPSSFSSTPSWRFRSISSMGSQVFSPWGMPVSLPWGPMFRLCAFCRRNEGNDVDS